MEKQTGAHAYLQTAPNKCFGTYLCPVEFPKIDSKKSNIHIKVTLLLLVKGIMQLLKFGKNHNKE
jgi:hypothetical protein